MKIQMEESLELCRFQNSNHWWFTESPYLCAEKNEQFWDRKIRNRCKIEFASRANCKAPSWRLIFSICKTIENKSMSVCMSVCVSHFALIGCKVLDFVSSQK